MSLLAQQWRIQCCATMRSQRPPRPPAPAKASWQPPSAEIASLRSPGPIGRRATHIQQLAQPDGRRGGRHSASLALAGPQTVGASLSTCLIADGRRCGTGKVIRGVKQQPRAQLDPMRGAARAQTRHRLGRARHRH